MKYIVLIIIILLITPYYSFSNEYITIRVCKAVAGCPVNTVTGECPTCINERRKVKGYNILKKRRENGSKISRNSLLLNCELCIGYFLRWKR
tara:strand:- start:206 stop:481 length:276 start_codon:yes stop_codon:yes gene_type:complete